MKQLASLLFLIVIIASSCLKKEKETKDNPVDTGSSAESVGSMLRICTEYPKIVDKKSKSGYREAGALKYLLWPKTTKRLNVFFLDGNPSVQSRVLQTAKTWEKYCGIKFVQVSALPADIIVSFSDSGSWSYIGKSSRGKSPSMNFGWLTDSTAEIEYQRVVLHEFGHALGLVHEHSITSGNPIVWDSVAVIRYYMGSPNYWSQEDVYLNIFKKYRNDQLNEGSYDEESIMLYSFPKELTSDRIETRWNTTLSLRNKEYIGKLYPPTGNDRE